MTNPIAPPMNPDTRACFWFAGIRLLFIEDFSPSFWFVIGGSNHLLLNVPFADEAVHFHVNGKMGFPAARQLP
jgi:hypothetical protein